MRNARLPLFVLAALLLLSLAHGASITQCCRSWLDTVDAADRAAAAGDWDRAGRLLEDLEEDWTHSRAWLRLTVSHTTLDAAKSLLAQARLFAGLAQQADTRATLAQLRALLHQLDDGEQLSWENIL